MTLRADLMWVIPGLLTAAVGTNMALLVLLRAGGALIGIVFYLALLGVLWYRKAHGLRAVTVGGLAGFVVHVAEVVWMGWSDYPALMVLNLLLPALMVFFAWTAGRQVESGHRGHEG
jgi:hypothetical protein